MIASIDWGKLGELLWAAPLASLAVAVTYSLVILFAARAEAAQKQKASAAAGLYGALTLVAVAAFAGIVVFGISIITTK